MRGESCNSDSSPEPAAGLFGGNEGWWEWREYGALRSWAFSEGARQMPCEALPSIVSPCLISLRMSLMVLALSRSHSPRM